MITTRFVAVRPARLSRLAFYLWSRRLPPEHDAWVRSRIEAASFPFVVVGRVLMPSLLTLGVVAALFQDVLVTPVLVTVFVSLLQLLPGPRENQRQAALRWHGLLPGYRRLPVLHPFRPAEALLLVVIITVAAVGVGAVLSDDGCQAVPTATAERLRAVVVADDGATPVWKGARLGELRQVSNAEGEHFVAGLVYVKGNPFGPAVWRTLAPHSPLNDAEDVSIDAFTGLASEITPSLGTYSVLPPPSSALRATDCVSPGDL